MAQSAASTAYGAVAQIALEQGLPKAKRIFDDPLALQMLPPASRTLIALMGWRPLRAPMVRLMEKAAPGIGSAILSRKRYMDDALTVSLNSGIKKVVILGAGLDTLAYRNSALMTAHVYEVDLPEIITYKTDKLRQIRPELPPYVTYVPIDFESQTLESVLTVHGYSLDQKTFFVWEGVTQYLTGAGVRSTFEFLAKASAGSRLAFTYVIKAFIDGVSTYGLDSLYQRMRIKNQLWHFGLNPAEVAEFIGPYGWKIIERVGAEEYRERYVKPAGRSEPVAEIERAVYAQKV